MLCNVYRHASTPLHNESGGVVDVHVNITGLAIIRLYRSSPDGVRQFIPKVSEALTQSRSEVGAEYPCSRDELA